MWYLLIFIVVITGVILKIMNVFDKIQTLNNKIGHIKYTQDNLLSSDEKKQLSGLIDRLEKMGFFKYSESEAIKKAKNEILETGYLYGDTGREFFADAEDLWEGGVGEFLEELQPFLMEQGVNFEINDEEISEDHYEITVNDRTYLLYSAKEDDEETGPDLVTSRAFSIVNELLDDAGSKERIYALYGWNDQLAIFLTKEMFAEINSYEQNENEKPQDVGRSY